MRILAAPNAFKGSLPALAAARAIKEGILRILPQSIVTLFPISDGGDGLMDIFLWSEGGKRVRVWVKGPMGERRRSSFALLPAGEAVVEMARASGLALVPPRRRNPLLATSWGTGDLISAAARSGARTIIVGMGGSASSDGGAGMARALGVRFLDSKGHELPQGAAHLRSLARIDISGMLKTMKAVKIIAVSDVDNPLIGPRGSARIFGPQKGATGAMVKILEESLSCYAAVIKRELGFDVAKIPGSGAAGGLGAGLAAFLNAKIVPGAQWILKRLAAEKELARNDILVTGEGRMDATSFYGKAPIEMIKLAAKRKIPSALVCGQIDAALRRKLSTLGVKSAVCFADAGASPKNSMSKARHWASKAAQIVVQGLATLVLLGAAPIPSHCAGSSRLAKVDWLYFHRNEDGNLRADLAAIDDLLAQNPRDASVLWRKGRALVRVGESEPDKRAKIQGFNQAMDALKASVLLDPRDADAHFWLGVAMGRLGQSRGILHSLFLIKPLRREMATVLALNPNFGGAHRVLGEMDLQIPRFAGGSISKGILEIETSVRLDPSYTDNYLALAEAYESVGRKADAVAILKKALEVKDPADPSEYPDDIKRCLEMLEKLGAPASNAGSGARP